MLLDLWPTLESCWDADWCVKPPINGAGGRQGRPEPARRRTPYRDTDEDILAALGLFGPEL